MSELILASVSPRREQLLREMGLRFRIVRPDGAAEELTGAAPEVLARENARRKARVVAAHHPDALVLGADTIVVLAGEIFGKPRDRAEAVAMLERLTGRRHEVITGVALIHRCLDTEIVFADTTGVWMRPLSRPQLEAYLAKVNPLDKAGARNNCAAESPQKHPVQDFAGAYAIQEHGDMIVERIAGSYSNVVGLPVERLRATLQKLGRAGTASR